MTRTGSWGDSKIRLLATAPKGRSGEEALADLGQMLDDVRIKATPVIVEDSDDETVQRESSASSVVFLPFRLTEQGPTGVNNGPMDPLIRRLGITALVLARQDIVLDAEPEEGKPAQVAEAMDAA
jgi:hypothetical protein